MQELHITTQRREEFKNKQLAGAIHIRKTCNQWQVLYSTVYIKSPLSSSSLHHTFKKMITQTSTATISVFICSAENVSYIIDPLSRPIHFHIPPRSTATFFLDFKIIPPPLPLLHIPPPSSRLRYANAFIKNSRMRRAFNHLLSLILLTPPSLPLSDSSPAAGMPPKKRKINIEVDEPPETSMNRSGGGGDRETRRRGRMSESSRVKNIKKMRK